MQKVMKNWIFTLIIGVLLLALAAWLILDVTVIGEWSNFASIRFLNYLTAAVLVLYTAIGLIPMFTYYRGKNIFFLIGEIVLTLAMAAVFVIVEIKLVDWIPQVNPCQAFGLALWLRMSVMIVRAYLQQDPPPVESRPVLIAADEEDPEKVARRRKKEKRITARTPLWALCLLILASALGVWQMSAPLLNEEGCVWAIAIVAAAFVVVFTVLTVQNIMALPKKPKKAADEEEAAEAEDALPAAEENDAVEEADGEPAALAEGEAATAEADEE